MDDAFPRALELLARHFGYSVFRPSQERVVRSILAGRDTLAVLPTGAGKSVCFQVPALVLGGLTVVISPLLALMEDQVAAARARGIRARALNSLLSKTASQAVRRELGAGEVDLLYIAPERCPRLVADLEELGVTVRFLAIDEAHCIAEWGSDFRPAYLGLGRFRRAVGSPLTAAFTGSATPEVRSTIARVLGLGRGGGYGLQVASFDRRNLAFSVARVGSEPARLERLTALLGADDRVAIVYGPTRNIVEGLARELARRGFRVAPYHAGLVKAERAQVLGDFLADRLEVVVATCAFGMGIDKPNVRLVVHWMLPATPEAYYQEAGRAGRDGAPARCVLLYRPGDGRLARRELGVTFPDPKVVEAAWADPEALAKLPRHAAEAAERLRRELRPERGPVRWDLVLGRRAAALERLTTMERYAERTACRRAALLGYFGERLIRCSGCDVCGEPAPRSAWPPAATRRLRDLRLAVGNARRPWGTPMLEPTTLARLALDPPATLEALAAVPGVGAELAHRFGETLLAALGGSAGEPAPPPVPPELVIWRRQLATRGGRPDLAVASGPLLGRVAARAPRTVGDLARVPGIGPRFLAKYGAGLLDALRSSVADSKS
jgi:ATP-dependent DNA helicase RecQ